MKILKSIALFLAVVLLGTMTVITSSANEGTSSATARKTFTMIGDYKNGGQLYNMQKYSLGAGTYTVTVLTKSATSTRPEFYLTAESIGAKYKVFNNKIFALGENISDKENYTNGSVNNVDDAKTEYSFTIAETVAENKDIYVGFLHTAYHLNSENYEFTWSISVTKQDGTKIFPEDTVLYDSNSVNNKDYADKTELKWQYHGKIICADYDETVFFPKKTVTVSGDGTNYELKFLKKVENVSSGQYKVTFSQKAKDMAAPTIRVLGDTAASSSAYTLVESTESNYSDKEYTFNVTEDNVAIFVGFIFSSQSIKGSFCIGDLKLVKVNDDGSYSDNLISWLGYKDWYEGTSKLNNSLYTTMNRFLVTISDYDEYSIYPKQIVKFSINRKYQGQQYILKRARLESGTYTASFSVYGYGIASDKLMFAVRTANASVRLTLGEGQLPNNANLYNDAVTGLNTGKVTFTLNEATEVFIGFLLYDDARKNNPSFYVTDLTLTNENDSENLITPIPYCDWYKGTGAGDLIGENYYYSASSEINLKFFNAGLTDKTGDNGSPDGVLDIRDLVAINEAQIPTIDETTGIYTYGDNNPFGFDLEKTRVSLLNGVYIPESNPIEKFS